MCVCMCVLPFHEFWRAVYIFRCKWAHEPGSNTRKVTRVLFRCCCCFFFLLAKQIAPTESECDDEPHRISSAYAHFAVALVVVVLTGAAVGVFVAAAVVVVCCSHERRPILLQ